MFSIYIYISQNMYVCVYIYMCVCVCTHPSRFLRALVGPPNFVNVLFLVNDGIG